MPCCKPTLWGVTDVVFKNYLIGLFLSIAWFASTAYSAATPPTYDVLIQQGKTQLQGGNAGLALDSSRGAIKLSATRWEGYALAGGALMNLKRYEEAADSLSEAIKNAPEAKQPALRDLRRQCLLAESGSPAAASTPPPATTTSQAEIVLWKSIENSANLADFQSYLDQYPQGAFAVLARRHLAEADAKAEESRWRSIEPNRNIANLRSYLAQYPQGQFSALAQRYLLEKTAASAETVAEYTEKSLIKIPAGSFQMGSAASENDRLQVEGPVHTVAVHSFLLSKYLVTRAEFSSFLEAAAYKMGGSNCVEQEFKSGEGANNDGNWRHPGFLQSDRDPVVCIGWNDAQAYVEWLSLKTRHHYRLMTEAEYEYAARAGSTTARYWGEIPDQACDYANVADLSFRGISATSVHNCDDHSEYTAPVGSYKPNGFDLYDMLGNVWEWTQDCYHDNYNGAPIDGSAWTSGDCQKRVIRGGSWNSPPTFVRVSARSGDGLLAVRSNVIGFRLARDP
jgi:formylglycine-generating enzyme required for sulfatase activity